ncbi:6482_t:CDS:1, partial [Scutellospora calospora]
KMNSQEESSTSFQKNIYTDESDSDNNSDDIIPSTNTLISPNKKRNKGKTSFVWKYFEVIGSKDICQVVVKKKGKDQKCGKEYIHNNSTSNMIAHLQSHNIVDSKKLKSELQKKRQTTLPEMIKSNTPHR